MCKVYDHNIFSTSFSAGIVFRGQNLTYKDVRFWRLKSIPHSKGYKDKSRNKTKDKQQRNLHYEVYILKFNKLA